MLINFDMQVSKKHIATVNEYCYIIYLYRFAQI